MAVRPVYRPLPAWLFVVAQTSASPALHAICPAFLFSRRSNGHGGRFLPREIHRAFDFWRQSLLLFVHLILHVFFDILKSHQADQCGSPPILSVVSILHADSRAIETSLLQLCLVPP